MPLRPTNLEVEREYVFDVNGDALGWDTLNDEATAGFLRVSTPGLVSGPLMMDSQRMMLAERCIQTTPQRRGPHHRL
jgi:hypothetical protein